MKKKIGFFITKGIWGGASRYVFDLASTLDQNVFDVFVVCGQEGELSARLEEIGIRVYKISSMQRDIKISKEIKTLRLMYNILKKERPDAIHLNSPKASGLASLLGRLLGVKKIIYTVHGLSFNEDRNWIEKMLIKFFTWLTVNFATRTILLSHIEYNQISHWPFIKNKLSVIPLGITSPHFETKERARTIFSKILNQPFSNEDIIVGTIAELHKNKGLIYALESFQKLPNIKYIIISDGEEKEKLQSYCKEHSIRNIYFTGQVKDASKLLKGFDIFLLPSIKEGLPYVLFEAGYAQIPIVTTNIGGIPELMEQNCATLINPKDSGAITTSIQEILKNPLKSKDFCDNLKQKIETRYSKEIMFKAISGLYL